MAGGVLYTAGAHTSATHRQRRPPPPGLSIASRWRGGGHRGATPAPPAPAPAAPPPPPRAGVPFNVRDKRTCGLPDHTVWHIFVMGGSYCHYVAIYILVQSFPVQDPLLPAAPPPPVVG